MTRGRRTTFPGEYYDMFRKVDFPLPENFREENDPYGDSWAMMSDEQRAKLPEWMRVYYSMTTNLDWNVGRLLSAIDKLGLGEDTIFVFTSDHGEMFGAQGRKAKNIFYEEAVRIPFLMRWSETIPEGLTTDVCLNTPDIMPTLFSMMELPITEDVEGSDLSPAAFDQTFEEPEAAFMQGMGCTAKWEDGYEWRALRTKQHTYAVHRPDGSEKLFDNIADPFQTRNLIDIPTSQGILNELRVLLKTTHACT